MTRRVPVRHGVVELADEGPRKGECVVLLHGFTGRKESWRGLRACLARTRRVVSLDLPGHGGTRVDPEAFTMDGAARAVTEAIDAIGVDRLALVGYSMGGRLALLLALSLRRRVSRLVVESASAGIADENERTLRRASDEELAGSIEREGVTAFVERWEGQPLFASLRDLPRDRCDELRLQRLACDPAGLAASLRGMGTGAQPWLGDRLAGLSLPVLLVAGARDGKFVAVGQSLEQAIPSARLFVVEGAGHVPHLECPEKFQDLVAAFLEDTALHDHAS